MTRDTKNTVSNAERITVDRVTLAKMIGCGEAMADQVGKEAGAKIKLGSRALYVVSKVEKHLESLAE